MIGRSGEKLSINISFAATSNRLSVMTVLNFFILIKAVHLQFFLNMISTDKDLWHIIYFKVIP